MIELLFEGRREQNRVAETLWIRVPDSSISRGEYGSSFGCPVTYENTGSEPLVILRYFGSDSCPNAPGTGAFKNLKRG